MRTLDRYVVRTFLTSAVLLLVAMISLRIVIDLFLNMDEFLEESASPDLPTLLMHMGSYYAYRSLMYFAELGGAIIVAAAGFTLARMNHTNELTAMLASGVSLHRVILPIIVVAMALGGLIILDREVVIPPNAPKLVREPDEAERMGQVAVELVPDGSGTVWLAPEYDPADGVMRNPILTLRDEDRRRVASIVSHGTARRAKFKPRGTAKMVVPEWLRGWDITAAALSRAAGEGTPWENTPTVRRAYTRIGPVRLLAEAKQLARRHGLSVPPDADIPSVSGIPPVQDPHYTMTLTTRAGRKVDELVLDPVAEGQPRGGRLNHPVFVYSDTFGPGRRVLAVLHATSATWVPGESADKSHWLLENGKLFYPSDLAGEDLVLRQSGHWLELMSSSELTRLLNLGRVPDRDAAMLAKHTRFADPINNLILLLLGVPFILSRERNIKASATFSVLLVGSYYATIHVCRLIGLPPMFAAFLPIGVFGIVAVLMLDSVKT